MKDELSREAALERVKRAGVEAVAEFVARGGVVQVLPSYGNMFPFDPLVGVPHG